MGDEACVGFLQRALPRLKFRWTGFRRVRGQVCKRLKRRMRVLELDSFADYWSYLQANESEWAVLDAMCRVVVSRFWRDRVVYEQLRDVVLLELSAQAEGNLRCWSAGCASGEEPYSLALACRHAAIDGALVDIIATDADAYLLQRAAEGTYAPATLRELPSGWIDAHFTECGSHWRIHDDVRRVVDFRCQDLREQMPDGPLSLLLCRNMVFTYFDLPLQRELLGQMRERLRVGGALVIGSHEQLPSSDGFEPWPGTQAVYRRNAA